MRKLLRIISIVLVISTLCVLVSSCHGKKKNTAFNVPSSFDTSKTYNLTFWAKNDSNVTQKKIYEKTILNFESIYPNIKITMKSYSDYSRIYNDVITNIPTNTTPNICITYPDNVATYITGENVVVELDNLFNDEKFGFGGSEIKFDGVKTNELIQKFMDEGLINGKHYTVPFMRSSEACYINKDLVEKLGYTIPETLTWDFIWEVSAKAMEKDENGVYKVNNQKVLIPFIYKSTDNMMIQMLMQKDIPYSNENGDILIFNDETKELLYQIAEEAKTGSFSTFKISSYPGNFLNAGQCIFAIDSTAGSTWMGSGAPNSDIQANQKVPFEMVVKEVPQFDVSSPKMISQGPSICIFNKEDPNEVIASWLFVQYLLSNDVQVAYSKTEAYIPVTTKAQTSQEYLDYLARAGEDNDVYYAAKIETAKMVLDNIENTFVTPVFNGSAYLREAAGQLIENVVKSVRRKETIDEDYMTKLYSDVESLYRLDQISSTKNGKLTFGKLPYESIILIVSLGVIWTGIIIYFIVNKTKNKRAK